MKKIPGLLFLAAFFIVLQSCNNSPASKDTESVYTLPEEIKALPFGTTLGLRAPEIELPNPEGQMMKLSDLQGKLVLLDFWASWCNPCRKENPELVKVYKEFAASSFTVGQGFEIYSVSLDRNEEAWKEAIETDKLTWPNMVSDMLAAKSKATIDYGIQMIPSNFLLDQNGVIIAINLRGNALSEKLESLLETK